MGLLRGEREGEKGGRSVFLHPLPSEMEGRERKNERERHGKFYFCGVDEAVDK